VEEEEGEEEEVEGTKEVLRVGEANEVGDE
jgi:hypothetical protein